MFTLVSFYLHFLHSVLSFFITPRLEHLLPCHYLEYISSTTDIILQPNKLQYVSNKCVMLVDQCLPVLLTAICPPIYPLYLNG